MDGLMTHYTVHPSSFSGIDFIASVIPCNWVKTVVFPAGGFLDHPPFINPSYFDNRETAVYDSTAPCQHDVSNRLVLNTLDVFNLIWRKGK
jgi:hypothetical protein